MFHSLKPEGTDFFSLHRLNVGCKTQTLTELLECSHTWAVWRDWQNNEDCDKWWKWYLPLCGSYSFSHCLLFVSFGCSFHVLASLIQTISFWIFWILLHYFSFLFFKIVVLSFLLSVHLFICLCTHQTTISLLLVMSHSPFLLTRRQAFLCVLHDSHACWIANFNLSNGMC